MIKRLSGLLHTNSKPSKVILIWGSFLILSLLSCIILMNNGVVYGGSDTNIQLSRVMELKNAVSSFNFFPQISINQFDNIGGAIMGMYPYLNLFPIALLSLVFKLNANVFYLSFMIKVFVGLLIGYYASYGNSKNFKISYLFTLIYNLSSLFLAYNFRSMDLGVVTVLIALPLVIFGFIAWIEKNKWLELTIGISIIIFSHVLSTVFIVCFLIIWALINWRKINEARLANLSKAIILMLLVTAFVWINGIVLMLTNNINAPGASFLTGTSLFQIITNGFSFSSALNGASFGIGSFAILGIILSLLYYRKWNATLKQMYWLGILITLLSSDIFPWHLFEHTPLQVLQFPFRLFIIPQILLSYLFAVSLITFIDHHLNAKAVKTSMCVFSIVVIFMQLTYQHDIIEYFNNQGSYYNRIDHRISDKHSLPFNVKTSSFNYSLDTARSFDNLTDGRLFLTDYLPKESLPKQQLLSTGRAIDDNTNVYPFNHIKNGKFQVYNYNDTLRELTLPFVTYNNYKYSVYVNGHLVPSVSNKYHLLKIKNVKSGNNIVTIKTSNPLGPISLIISILGSLIYLIYLFKKSWITSVLKIIHLKK